MTVKKDEADGKRPRTIYLPPDLDRRLRSYAADADRPVSQVIEDAVREHLKGWRSK